MWRIIKTANNRYCMESYEYLKIIEDDNNLEDSYYSDSLTKIIKAYNKRNFLEMSPMDTLEQYLETLARAGEVVIIETKHPNTLINKYPELFL